MNPLNARLHAALNNGFAMIPIANAGGEFSHIALVRGRDGAIDVAQFAASAATIVTRFQVPLGPPDLHRFWPVIRSTTHLDPVDALDALIGWPHPDEETLRWLQ
jgi:hypothetical protein